MTTQSDQLGAEDVKTYIAELGHGLVEFMTIGTAVKQTAGVRVATPTLPVQAMVPDNEHLDRRRLRLPTGSRELSHSA